MPIFSGLPQATGMRCVVTRWWRAATAIGGALTLAACQSFSPDGGLSAVASIAHRELHSDVVALRTQDDALAAQARVTKLLKRPLTAETAAQIALLNNRALQAAYNELGMAEAVKVRQSLPTAPSISIMRISSSAETEIERQIVGNILALATLPARTNIAASRFRQAQLTAALATLRVAREARRAFYRAVAAQQVAGLFEQSTSAATTAEQLAKRLRESGAMNKLDQAREQAFRAELTTRLAAARQRAMAERERLIRALGLSGREINFKLPKDLPQLPRHKRTLLTVERDAVGHRIDLQIARLELQTLARSYGLTKVTRFINVLDAGYADKITDDNVTGENIRDRGFTVSFEVPLFDFGEARLREAEQAYMKALNDLAQKAVVVRSQAREAYRDYQSTYDIVRHYDREVLPLRKVISDELMLRYGAMQVDVFTLLADAREGIAAKAAAVDALRDFWLASADLSAATTGGLPSTSDGGDLTTAMPAAAGAVGTK